MYLNPDNPGYSEEDLWGLETTNIFVLYSLGTLVDVHA